MPLASKNIERFKSKHQQVSQLGATAEKLVDDVVKRHAGALDEFVVNVEEYLDKLKTNPNTKLDDARLHRMVLRLPVLQYHLIDIIDRAMLETNVAKTAKELMFSRYVLEADGTIPEKQAEAMLQTADESAMVDLSKHVHNRLKQRMEVCSDMLDALKKIIGSRDIERQLFRRDSASA